MLRKYTFVLFYLGSLSLSYLSQEYAKSPHDNKHQRVVSTTQALGKRQN